MQLVEISPVLPAALSRLPELAGNLSYSWHRAARALFEDLDQALWRQTQANPRLMLRCVSQATLDAAAKDQNYLRRYAAVLENYDRYQSQAAVRGGLPLVAYFCAEYGFHESFPNYSGGISISAPLGNRTAQGDYGIDQLTHRQSQLSAQRDINAIVVDISARMAALRQSRARYTAAVNTRALQEQLLAADRSKFASGMATFTDIINDQRALVVAQISEVNALAAYAHARVSLDQTLGETLERNGVTLEEGLSGKVARESRMPDVVQQ